VQKTNRSLFSCIMVGYSTKAVIVVDVTIIRVEIGIVVEIIQPRSPPHE